MTVKWETVKAGDRLYDVHSYKMGNTTMRSVGVWDVVIREVNHAEGWATVSWNGNPDQRWRQRQVVKLRRKAPELVRTFTGAAHIKPRARKARPATPAPAEGE